MKKIATLGPRGTFSEFAVSEYMKKVNSDVEIKLYPTMTKVIKAAEGNECDIAILPIENTLDGFVQINLDLLNKTNLNIVNELIVPIQFGFAANSEIEDVKRIYVQFKTQGQCSEFLENNDRLKIVTTESNGESLEKLKEGISNEGAIIPTFVLRKINNFKYHIDDVTDSQDNETRFLVLSKEKTKCDSKNKYKTGIIISDADADKPGTLWRVLNEFAVRKINLTSIISRPTKQELGQYYFFIEVEGCYSKDEKLIEAVEKIKNHSVVKVVGTYSMI